MSNEIAMPGQVEEIIKRLTDSGFEAYAVGGCVRDSLLNREPGDWDITTSASPGQVKEIFRRTIDTGIEHGTVTIMLGRCGYEVTTYRIDGRYEDGRHPASVQFTPSLKEDLKRRDFTINAMAYNHESGIVDLFGGMEDLKRKVIRCVGDAHHRFEEDALRILRAVRFSAQLGFEIEEKTRQAVCDLAPSLARISMERIQMELTKLLVSEHPDYIRFAYETGITKVVLPEFDAIMETEQNNPYHCYSVGEHTLAMLEHCEADPVLRWTALLHDIGKPLVKTVGSDGCDHFYRHGEAGSRMADQILKRLKFDNDTIARVTKLVKWHDYAFNMTKANVRRAMNRVGEELFPSLLKIMWADNMAKSDYAKSYLLQAVKDVGVMYGQIVAEKDCITLKDLAVTGSDLIAAGMEPGREIGQILNRMLEDVLDSPEHNTKEYLMQHFI